MQHHNLTESLFKSVIFGDTGALIFSYSRLFWGLYVKKVLEWTKSTSSTQRLVRCPVHCDGPVSSIKEITRIPTDLSYKSFFCARLWDVYYPFDDSGFPVFSQFEYPESGVYCSLRWIGTKRSFMKCLKKMKMVERSIHNAKLLCVYVDNTTGIVTINHNPVGYTKTNQGYGCLLLYILHDT